MMKKAVAVLLCSVLIISLGACQKTGSNNSESSVLEDVESVTTDSLPADAETMEEVLLALAITSQQSGEKYAVWNSTYFWTACSWLISLDYEQDESASEKNGEITIPADDAKKYANALFGAYDGNTKELPEVPENLDFVSLDQENNTYVLEKQPVDGLAFIVSSCTDYHNGICQIKGTLSGDEGKLGEFTADMQETSFEGMDNPIYNYMIISLKMNINYDPKTDSQDVQQTDDSSSQTDASGSGQQTSSGKNDASSSQGKQDTSVDKTQDQSSSSSQNSDADKEQTATEEDTSDDEETGSSINKDEALSLIEKRYGANGETDPETGNIISYRYIGVAVVNGKNYYNYSMNWILSDGNGGGRSSYLTNLFVSLDDGSIHEGSQGGSGGWQFN